MSSLPEEHLRRSMRYGSTSPTGPHNHHSKELTLTVSMTPSELEESTKSFKDTAETEPPSITFTRVDTPQIGHDTFGDDFTAKALKNCKKTVLGPYHVFLKVIGWRRFSPHREISLPLHYKILNVIWPVVLTLLLITSCITQILLCFSRDYFVPRRPINGSLNITCSEHIGSSYIVLDILLIFAYVYGVYIFRIKEPEHLTTFAETVFLGIISRKGYYSPKYLIKSMQFLMLLGLIWIVYSMCVSIVRIFAHRFFQDNIHFEFLPLGHGHFQNLVLGVVVVISILGFIVFDVAYTAVVINYSIQCQLMVYYLQGISTRILNREWEIDQSIKEIHSARQFLCKLNSHMSKATGIMLFIFLTSSFYAVYGLEELDTTDYHAKFLAIVYIFSILQWLLWLLLPLIQAARVTHSGAWLLKTALEIRSRPYVYSNSPQLDLDSFVLYCANINMKAKLFSVPISPGIVVGGAFIVGFAFYLVFNISEKSFSWASWI